PFAVQSVVRELAVKRAFHPCRSLHFVEHLQLYRAPVHGVPQPPFGGCGKADLDRACAVFSAEEVDVAFPHAASPCFGPGHRSGRRSLRETAPSVTSSMRKTVLGAGIRWPLTISRTPS